MVVLQENKAEFPKTHFALAVNEGDIDAAASTLRKQGITVKGPILIEWMPAKSIYFRRSRRSRFGAVCAH